MTDNVLDELRTLDPMAYAAVSHTASELLATIHAENAGGDPLPVSCPLPECGEVLDGREAWSDHAASHTEAAR